MLMITRKNGQKVTVGDVTITVYAPCSVKLGIEAPKGTPIQRDDMKKEKGQLR
jgi:sRNA-binding carbon storage regulator CsrA